MRAYPGHYWPNGIAVTVLVISPSFSLMLQGSFISSSLRSWGASRFPNWMLRSPSHFFLHAEPLKPALLSLTQFAHSDGSSFCRLKPLAGEQFSKCSPRISIVIII